MIKEWCIFELHRCKWGKQNLRDSPYEIEVVVGMKVMVTNNVETDLDITDGVRGEIVDIILHPDEPPDQT